MYIRHPPFYKHPIFSYEFPKSNKLDNLQNVDKTLVDGSSIEMLSTSKSDFIHFKTPHCKDAYNEGFYFIIITIR